MEGQLKERWMQLCEQAAVEQDTYKLMLLIQEINRLLEEKEQDYIGSIPKRKTARAEIYERSRPGAAARQAFYLKKRRYCSQGHFWYGAEDPQSSLKSEAVHPCAPQLKSQVRGVLPFVSCWRMRSCTSASRIASNSARFEELPFMSTRRLSR